MTCQWCKHFRYKIIGATCARPGGDGRIVPAKGRASECAWFDPRRTCTTCKFRCSYEEKSELCVDGAACKKWTLRPISKWGGSRRIAKRSAPEQIVSYETTKQGENQ